MREQTEITVPPHLSDAERALWEKADAAHDWLHGKREDVAARDASVQLSRAVPENLLSLLTALSTEREAGERRRYRTLRAIALSDSAHWRALDCGDGAFTEAEFDKLVDSAGPETPREAGTTGWPCIYCGKPRTEHRYGGYACPVESGLWAERDYAPNMHQHISFAALVAYGRSAGGNIVNGMPWSFTFNGVPITHENDECYLICGAYPQRFTSRDTLAVGPFGQLVVLYAPTPPSDAGTSERETCVEAITSTDYSSGFMCGKPLPCSDHSAALPGAEAGTPDERFDQLLHDLLHAYAKLHTLPFIAEEDASDAGAAVTLALQKVKRLFGEVTRSLRAESTELSDRLADLTARHNELRVAMIGAADEAAALTSEVRALREDKARLDAIDAQYRSGPDGYLVLAMNGWRIASYRDGYHVAADVFSEPIVDGATLREAIDAARLASPSPTGAP